MNGSEVDIFLCKSGELVVFHDKKLDRLTNVQGYIEDRIRTTVDCNYVSTQGSRLFPEAPAATATGASYLAEIDETTEYMLDPISGSAAKGKIVLGIVCIHVDDCFSCGGKAFYDRILAGIKKDFEIGSEDINDVMYCGQRVRWIDKGKPTAHITVDQDLKVEELSEIEIPPDVKEKGNLNLPLSLVPNFILLFGHCWEKLTGYRIVLDTTRAIVFLDVRATRRVRLSRISTTSTPCVVRFATNMYSSFFIL